MSQEDQLEAAAKAGIDMKMGVRKELKRIHEHLVPTEDVLYMTEGFYKGRGIIVVTDQRVIFFSAGIIRSSVEEFPIKSISSIQYKTGLMFGEITIHASNNKAEIEQIKKSRAAEMAQIVRSLIDNQESSGGSKANHVTQIDPTEQLREFAKLKEEGILSEDEFLAKKAQILGL